MVQSERLLQVIRHAKSCATAHLSGLRDASTPAIHDVQIEEFLAMLSEMEADISSGRCPPRLPTMAHIIADSWPLDSELGRKIIEAEQLYGKMSAH